MTRANGKAVLTSNTKEWEEAEEEVISQRLGLSKLSIKSAASLINTDFPELLWVVPGIIPQGLTLLSGKPKVGKSWVSLDLAIAVATGDVFLGRLSVDKGHVLYLALEDSERRIKQRLLKTTANIDASLEWLDISTTCPQLGAGLEEELTGWIESHTGSARLIIVDVLQKVRGKTESKDIYKSDYKTIEALKGISDEYNIAVVVVTHNRKRDSNGDFLDDLSGSYGLTGGADTIAVMQRDRNTLNACLNITGRDVEEEAYNITFDKKSCRWVFETGQITESHFTETQRLMLDFMKSAGVATVADLIKNTDVKESTIKTQLKRWDDAKEFVIKVGRGQYKYVGSGTLEF